MSGVGMVFDRDVSEPHLAVYDNEYYAIGNQRCKQIRFYDRVRENPACLRRSKQRSTFSSNLGKIFIQQ